MDKQFLKSLLESNQFYGFDEFSSFKAKLLRVTSDSDNELNKKLLNSLAVFLYGNAELKFKKILISLLCLNPKISKRKLYRFNIADFKSELKNRLSIDITILSGYDELNELRLIKNCLQHDGIVNDELEKANSERWKKGNEVDTKIADLERFFREHKKFFEELKKQIDAHLDHAGESRERITDTSSKLIKPTN